MEQAPLYRQLAHHYLEAIEAQTLLPGDRMPSVRSLMQRHDVSLSTALEACRYLESRGAVEARPRSGYFVRPRKPALTPVSEPLPGLPDPAQYVGIHQRVSKIIAAGQQAGAAFDFAGATAAPEIYPAEALQKAAIGVLRRNPGMFGHAVPHDGDPHFRAVLARRALSAGIKLGPEDIIVTNGCIEALNLALRAVTQPGDTVAVESPTFFGLLQVLEGLGLRALEIPNSPQTGISLEALELAAQTYGNIKALVVVPTFQNPHCSVMPDAHKERLVAWCEARGTVLIEDDTYAESGFSDTPPAALKSWDRNGSIIHCASLHKVFAPGMRLGWIAPGKWFARVAMLKYSQSRSNEALMQIAAGEYMGSSAYDRHLRRLRAHLRNQRENMASAIAAYFPVGTRFSIPQGGMTLWLELPGGRSSETLFHKALQEGIRVSPGVMYSNSRRFEPFVRLNCGATHSRESDQALRRLGLLAEALPEGAAG